MERIKELPVEKFFLVIALFFGLLYVFILPPFQSVDEASHFYRGYEIATNKFVPQKTKGRLGDWLPASLKAFSSNYDYLIKNVDAKTSINCIIDSGKIKLNPEKVEFVDFQNTALYSPVAYLSQVPGMFIAKTFGANPLTIFYLARVSNLLFFMLFIWLSIKIIPFYKLPLMLLSLAPMTLSLAGALTTDVVVIGINFLWVALVLNLIFREKKVNWPEIFPLTFLAVILALSKHYLMLIPLVFLLPKSRFKSTSSYLACVFSILAASAVAVFLWQNSIGHLYVDLNPNANIEGQLSFILSHPLDYLKIVLETLILKTPRIIITMIGVLGWQDTRLDFLTYMLYPILIVLAVILEKNDEFSFKKWQLSLIFADFAGAILVIFTTMYLMWSAVGSSPIMGLNGKYFTPLMLPFLLLFHNKIKVGKNGLSESQKRNLKLFIYAAIVLILISSELSLIHRFYGLTPNLLYKI